MLAAPLAGAGGGTSGPPFTLPLWLGRGGDIATPASASTAAELIAALGLPHIFAFSFRFYGSSLSEILLKMWWKGYLFNLVVSTQFQIETILSHHKFGQLNFLSAHYISSEIYLKLYIFFMFLY